MLKGFEKRFNNGDIVYWCSNQGNGKFSVQYGVVNEQFSDAVVVDYIVPRERRLVNGVPIMEFESEDRYKKLPKGWNYQTMLYEITYEDINQEEKEYLLNKTNSNSIKTAFEKGYFVKKENTFLGNIESDITKDGYRIIKQYPYFNKYTTHISIRPDKLYYSYEEAEKEVRDNISEFERQANLSDYDWSVEKIDEVLNRWKYLCNISDNDIKEYRQWLLDMKDVEDIELRIYQGEIQWKYWKNKKWSNIEL